MTQRRNRRSGVEDRWQKADGSPTASAGTGLRWRARYVDDDGKEPAKGFRTKAAAKAWLEEIVSSQVTGTYVDPVLGRVTFSSFYRDWSSRQVWESGTRHTMDLSANCVTFGNKPLADVRKSDVELWVKDMQRNKLQPTTIRTRFANVHAAIRVASSGRPRLMPEDVCVGVKLPPARKASAAMDVPESAEVGKIIDAANEWFAVFVAVSAFAGTRRGETSAVRVSDCDFLRKELRIERQVHWTEDGRMEIRPPKYGSERTVYIPDGLVTILAEYIRVHRPGDDADRYLFPGQPRRHRSCPCGDGGALLAYRLRDSQGEVPAARLSTLLRLRTHPRWVRRRHRPAGVGPLRPQRHVGHVLAPLAERRRPHPDGSTGPRRAGIWACCGRTADGSRKNPC